MIRGCTCVEDAVGHVVDEELREELEYQLRALRERYERLIDKAREDESWRITEEEHDAGFDEGKEYVYEEISSMYLRNLQRLSRANFNLEDVKSFFSMFCDELGVTEPNWENFKAVDYEEISSMYLRNLQRLSRTNFDLEDVKNFFSMFCEELGVAEPNWENFKAGDVDER